MRDRDRKYSSREGESEKSWEKCEKLYCEREVGHRFVRKFQGFARSSF
jgi:hypothetical protein